MFEKTTKLLPCFVFAVISTFILSASLIAEEPEGPGLVGSRETPLQEFELMLTPFDQAELTSIADAWLDQVKETVRALSAARIALQKGGAEDEMASEVDLLAQRSLAIDRLNLVLRELENKGGDVSSYKKYVSAVSDIAADVKNPSVVLSYVRNWAESPEGGIRWVKNIAFFLLTLIAFRLLAAIVARIIKKTLSLSRMKVSDLLKDFFVNTARKLVFLIGVVIALSMLEVNIGPFLAAIGAAGFVIGFALQGTLSNFAAGIMILFYRPYDLGDVVTASGVTGKVAAMSLVSTSLKTPDNQTLIVPNGSIWGGIITNITGSTTRRVDLMFGIGYDDSMEDAQKILEEVVKAHPKVLADPAPVIKVHELADSSVNFVCRPWSKTSDYWDVYWDLTRTVKEKFDEAGISIPYPQQDIHIHKVAAEA